MPGQIDLPINITGNAQTLLSEIKELQGKGISIDLKGLAGADTKVIDKLAASLTKLNAVQHNFDIKINYIGTNLTNLTTQVQGLANALNALHKAQNQPVSGRSFGGILGPNGQVIPGAGSTGGGTTSPPPRRPSSGPGSFPRSMGVREANAIMRDHAASLRSGIPPTYPDSWIAEAARVQANNMGTYTTQDTATRSAARAPRSAQSIVNRKIESFNQEANITNPSEYLLARISGHGDEYLRDQETKRGLRPGSLAGTKQDLVQPKRLFSKEAATQLAFAGLFGGLSSLIGGAVLGATPLGPTGVLLGSVIGQKAEGGLKFLKEKAEEFGKILQESGSTYLRSIQGIASILQSTSTVVGPNGEAVSLKEQVAFQRERATRLQLAARSQLLPLGIAGQTEASLSQGIAIALGQRGIDLTPSRFGKLTAGIGAKIQAVNPALLENEARLYRDLQDTFSGGALANKTTLSQVLGKDTVKKIGQARTESDFDKIISSLQPAIDVQKNTNNAVTNLNRLKGAIDNLQTKAGVEYLDKLAPAWQKLTETLSDPKTIVAVEKLAAGVGSLTAKFIEAGVKAGERLRDISSSPGAKAVGGATIGVLKEWGPLALVAGVEGAIAFRGVLRGAVALAITAVRTALTGGLLATGGIGVGVGGGALAAAYLIASGSVGRVARSIGRSYGSGENAELGWGLTNENQQEGLAKIRGLTAEKTEDSTKRRILAAYGIKELPTGELSSPQSLISALSAHAGASTDEREIINDLHNQLPAFEELRGSINKGFNQETIGGQRNIIQNDLASYNAQVGVQQQTLRAQQSFTGSLDPGTQEYEREKNNGAQLQREINELLTKEEQEREKLVTSLNEEKVTRDSLSKALDGQSRLQINHNEKLDNLTESLVHAQRAVTDFSLDMDIAFGDKTEKVIAQAQKLINAGGAKELLPPEIQSLMDPNGQLYKAFNLTNQQNKFEKAYEDLNNLPEDAKLEGIKRNDELEKAGHDVAQSFKDLVYETHSLADAIEKLKYKLGEGLGSDNNPYYDPKTGKPFVLQSDVEKRRAEIAAEQSGGGDNTLAADPRLVTGRANILKANAYIDQRLKDMHGGLNDISQVTNPRSYVPVNTPNIKGHLEDTATAQSKATASALKDALGSGDFSDASKWVTTISQGVAQGNLSSWTGEN